MAKSRTSSLGLQFKSNFNAVGGENMNNRSPLVGEDYDFACKHYYDMTAKQISEILRCNVSKITNAWMKCGLRGKYRRIYPISCQNYFSTIDTPAKAYYLGFIASDGCVYKRKAYNQQGLIRICIVKEDEEILVNLKKELGTEIPLHYHSGKYVSLEICCEPIYRDINNLGLHDRKTYDNTIPTDIPNHLFKYFIRGYFDGDGSITKQEKIELNKVNVSIAGYQNNMQKIIEFLKQQNILMTFSIDKRKHIQGKDNFGCMVAPNIISKYSFLRYIYENENAPYLKRKRDLALNFINAVENDNSAMKIITRIYYDHAVRIHTD